MKHAKKRTSILGNFHERNSDFSKCQSRSYTGDPSTSSHC
ncbi:hypothetical protein MTBBW1_790032 [Desulfamplus magnetovallimortis]|uniref:Uncharacterized protein n=1 Tax=Desulfamplus magnetovallimortis TaxID=1246637 RepID=A0A1W1HJI7_9BACT|nr:hypothetical protein MTBBW1_790032 [Desulfamplus magnetovallimortis]